MLVQRGVDWMNYFDHFHLARARWLAHYDQCVEELGFEYDSQERGWAEESWVESQSIRILYDGTIKIKWEHRCWWADCKHPVFHGEYYCILAGLDRITWEEPFARAKRLQEESE